MASLALGIGGGAAAGALITGPFAPIGAAIGAAVGAAVGAYIDSQFLYPAIFGKDTQQFTGPRLDDFHVQTASEGTPVKYFQGEGVRTAGQLIYASNLIERSKKEKHTSGKGGGGGGSSSVTTYRYYSHFAISWGEACPGGKIRKIWADAKLIYSDEVTSSITIPDCVVDRTGTTYKYTSSSHDFTADNLKVGSKINIAGCSNSQNNGVKTVKKVAANYIQVKESVVDETVSGDVTITYEPQIDARAKGITNYMGGPSQIQDPLLCSLIQAQYGANKMPAYKDDCYTVLEEFAMRDFGNRAPNFTALIQQAVQLPVGQAIANIIQRANVPVAYDVSEVRGVIQGYLATDPMTVAAQLEPILLAYNVGVVEDDGVLVFYSKGREHQVNIDSVYLASFDSGEGGDNAAHPFELVDTPNYDLPSRVEVRHFDPANNYQQGGQIERRINTTSVNVNSISLPITMDASKARDVARRILYSAHVESLSCKFTLPANYSNIQEGDLVVFNAFGESWSVRVESIERGANYLLAFSGVLAESNTYRSSAQSDDGNQTEVEPYLPTDLLMFLLDLPALRDQDTEQAGFYFALSLEDPSAQWQGGSVFESNDGGTTFEQLDSSSVQATAGTCLTTLGAGPVGVFDTKNTVDVELAQGTLESVSDLDCLNGSNRALVGGEIIGFANATYLGSKQYRLSKLLRGLRDTTTSVATHGSAESFLVLDSAINFISLNASGIDSPGLFKAVPSGATTDDVEDQTEFTPTAKNLRQFAPCNIQYSGTSGTDVVFSWLRRTRALARVLGTSFPILHDSETYRLSFYNGSTLVGQYTTTIAAGTGNGRRSFTYTSSQRNTDFGFSPTSFTMKIAQLGPTGYGNEATIGVSI